jgi:hypothetical protein
MVPMGLALLLGACGEERGSEPPAAETSTTSSSTTSTSLQESPIRPESTMPSVPPSNPKTAPTTVVDKAILDLLKRTKSSAEEVTVVLDEAVTWPDGALGCPQPGAFYTQALVDGSRILLETGGRLYAYHAGSDEEPFLCESNEGDGGYDWVPPPGFNT